MSSTVATLGSGGLDRLLGTEGVCVGVGPFVYRINSDIDSVVEGFNLLYAEYPLAGPGEFADFDIRIDRSRGLRRWIRPQARFHFDGDTPFEPLPIRHAMPLLEWAMNWCISTHAHQYLLLHAAVVERHGRALVLPAPPGSGKSTLCAGLVCRGWRLLSDELALVALDDGQLHPLCRPISLKNESLEVIRRFEPTAEFSRVSHDTGKGSVAHMKVRGDHLDLVRETAAPGWVVFPRYKQDAVAQCRPRARADSLIELARNSFNYSILGQAGFRALADMIDVVECFDFEYGDLDEAVGLFEAMSESARP